MLPIGTLVVKKNGKPFKSGKLINTVKGHIVNPNTANMAYVFEEDDSIVDIANCTEIDE